jgi:hypothetical protein
VRFLRFAGCERRDRADRKAAEIWLDGDCSSGRSRALFGRRPLSYISPVSKGAVGAGREFAETQAHQGRRRLKGSQECDEVLFLVPGELCTKDQVEELDRIVQRQQTTVMHVWRRVFDAAQRECLDRPVPGFP